MKNDFYRMKRLSVAWLVAGIVVFGLFIGLIFSICELISLALLFCLIPLGYALLAVAWRLTVKNARTVSSVLFLLLTLAVLALSGGLLWLIGLTLSLHPIESVLPLCTQVSLIVWYILFFILHKRYSHLIGLKEETETFYNEK